VLEIGHAYTRTHTHTHAHTQGNTMVTHFVWSCILYSQFYNANNFKKYDEKSHTSSDIVVDGAVV